MSTPVELTLHKTAKPITAGIISILVGSGCTLALLGIGIATAVSAPFWGNFPFHLPWLIGILALFPLTLGLLSIVGGICNLQRKVWGLALAGSITTLCLSFVLGVTSLVLTILSRDEFV
jgi:hypothetical protein